MSRTVWIAFGGQPHRIVLPEGGLPAVDGTLVAADIRLLEPGVLSLIVTLPDGTARSFRCIAGTEGEFEAVVIEGQRFPYTVADPRSLRATVAGSADTAGPRALRCPMPGRVVRVLVSVGDTVTAGQGCIVIEAMKMQNELKAPRGGRIARLSAAAGDAVPAGTTLLMIE